jgi:replicative DNA helicase
VTEHNYTIKCEISKLPSGRMPMVFNVHWNDKRYHTLPYWATVDEHIQDAAQEITEELGLDVPFDSELLRAARDEELQRLERLLACRSDGSDNFLSDTMNSATFARTEFHRHWLVENLLVANEPVIVAGPSKSCKTTIMIDLAISLAKGRPFLGFFRVPTPVNVAFISGESGEATIQETAIRVCRAKGLELEDADAMWNFKLPRLSKESDLDRLRAYLRDKGIQVVIIDPLYLCLTRRGSGTSTTNLFDVGPLLHQVAQICREAGATLILIHHTRQAKAATKGGIGRPAELTDIAFAGIGEFGRQWLVLSRRRAFRPGSGEHQLWLSAGGSAGQSGLWELDIEEGKLQTDFSGREWKVTVREHNENAQAEETNKMDRSTKNGEKVRETAIKIVAFLQSRPNGETKTAIVMEKIASRTVTLAALEALQNDGTLVSCIVRKPGGPSLKNHAGLKLAPIAEEQGVESGRNPNEIEGGAPNSVEQDLETEDTSNEDGERGEPDDDESVPEEEAPSEDPEDDEQDHAEFKEYERNRLSEIFASLEDEEQDEEELDEEELDEEELDEEEQDEEEQDEEEQDEEEQDEDDDWLDNEDDVSGDEEE